MAEIAVDFACCAEPGAVTFTHDLALDGDESLHVGDRVDLSDGVVTVPGIVTRRDERHGYWFFRVTEADDR
jgi:hypothetical protein